MDMQWYTHGWQQHMPRRGIYTSIDGRVHIEHMLHLLLGMGKVHLCLHKYVNTRVDTRVIRTIESATHIWNEKAAIT